ncbi:MAG: phospholipid/cholesterol/gamma-HCH transport system substrate-binding protein [Solirubrobacteraceae bacterium]|jgi:virulence factor Mce-like protein|nr:phospholipid/cholesterol/gamma-HCH transport system substrate-binding protein [Solirubrobacteraceae bacterium]
MRRKRGRKKPMSKFAAGAVGIVLIVIFSYLAYTKFANPFASPYTVKAVFANANGLQNGSLVRIAGVNVGTVTGVSTEPGCHSAAKDPKACNASEVTMTIQDAGLPIHDDATFAIRPRIFLEGNFFVDISPGTPETPAATDGHTFPIQQGVEPVQLDQVLTGLQSNTRQNLQTLLQQYGKAVKQGGPGYNRSIQYWLPAYEYTAIVSHDFLGTQPHDLSRYIAAQATVAGALNTHPQHLQSFVTDFNTTANAFAREQTSLRQAVGQLPRTLSTAMPAFRALNAAFPPLRSFAKALIPGVKTTPLTVDKSLPFITQLRLLVQPSELRGLTHDLRPTVPALAHLTQRTIPLMKNQVRPFASCVANVIYPWSQLTLHDSHFNASNGFPARKVYVEAVDFLPGLAGESRDFDANGPYIRILGNGGTLTYSLSPGFFGQSLFPLSSSEPVLPPGGKRPPYQENVPCETQKALQTVDTTNGASLNTQGGSGSSGNNPLGGIPLPLLHKQQSQTLNAVKRDAAAAGLKVRMAKGLR